MANDRLVISHISAIRFASFFEPIEAIIAVNVVPMFAPITIAIADSVAIPFSPYIPWTIVTLADEDCINPVNEVEENSDDHALNETALIISLNALVCAMPFIPHPKTFKPKKIEPIANINIAIFDFFSSLISKYIIPPIKASKKKYWVNSKSHQVKQSKPLLQFRC